MRRTTNRWRVALTLAAVYGHFLIYAQFGLVELLTARGHGDELVRWVLGAMAAGGMAGGFAAALRTSLGRPMSPRILLAVCGLLALASLATRGVVTPVLAAGLSGLALGAVTVTTATLLPGWLADRRHGAVWVGLGTGLGYAACNLPWVFEAPAAWQVAAGAGFAWAGAIVTPPPAGHPDTARPDRRAGELGLIAALAAFTALVWLDSAAFFIIQHQSEMREATWQDGRLWRNAGLHLAAAVAAGWWLARRGGVPVLATAWALLTAAGWMVNHEGWRETAGWLYPAGVSLYSTALVAWPGLLATPASRPRTAWRAAWLFAVAGWLGSANGVGMATRLESVPTSFLMIAAGALWWSIAAARDRKKEWLAAAAVAAIAIAGARSGPEPPTDPVERGRRVYVAEGCVHCHSRYVRPGTPEAEIWGPIEPSRGSLTERPVLIGNRRQGPDLLEVGARRSAAWLRLKLEQPRQFNPDTPMPAYAHLFDDHRGDDLVAYLQQPGVGRIAERIQQMQAWRPRTPAGETQADGARLFRRHCAVCHGAGGRGDGELAGRLLRPPANLRSGPFAWTIEGPDLDVRVARVIRFGIPGSDMPGHETLTDGQLQALVREVISFRRSEDER